jgi:hypothetical protein
MNQNRLSLLCNGTINTHNNGRAMFSIWSMQAEAWQFSWAEFQDTSLPGCELGSRGMKRWNCTEELKHQSYWVQFSWVESLAVKRFHMCCSYSKTGIISPVKACCQEMSRPRRLIVCCSYTDIWSVYLSETIIATCSNRLRETDCVLKWTAKCGN